MPYQSIKHLKVADSIVSQIEFLILEGTLKPGDQLPAERELAQELDVSRSSLRDAVIRMEAKGLLHVKPGGGTFVRDILGPTLTDPLVHLLKERPQALLDILGLRNALEEYAAYYAAERCTDADLEILEQRFTRLEAANDEQDLLQTAEAITEFQLAIAYASHNVALVHVTRGLYNLLRTTISHSLEILEGQAGSYEIIHQHRREVYEAIINRQPAAAQEAAHILIRFVDKSLRELGEQFHENLAEPQAPELFAPLELEHFRPTRQSDAIAYRLEQLLANGKLKPGDQLPTEKELAEKLGASRAAVRDAMVKMEAKGLLEIKRGGDAFVFDVPGPTIADPLVHLLKDHPEAAFDFLELRLSLEEISAYCAAKRSTKSDHESLQQRLAELTRHFQSNETLLTAEMDADFHLAIAEASHNTALVFIIRGLFNLLRGHVKRNLERLSAMHEEYEILQDHHQEILDAILAGDADRAKRAAHTHVMFVCQSLRELEVEKERSARSKRRLDVISGRD